MILKNLYESDELLAMRYLNTRMELTDQEKFQYLNLEKVLKGKRSLTKWQNSLKKKDILSIACFLK